MNILITGGAGFIGSNLSEFHIKRGDSVVAVDDLSTGRMENVSGLMDHSNYSFHEGDFMTWEI